MHNCNGLNTAGMQIYKAKIDGYTNKARDTPYKQPKATFHTPRDECGRDLGRMCVADNQAS